MPRKTATPAAAPWARCANTACAPPIQGKLAATALARAPSVVASEVTATTIAVARMTRAGISHRGAKVLAKATPAHGIARRASDRRTADRPSSAGGGSSPLARSSPFRRIRPRRAARRAATRVARPLYRPCRNSPARRPPRPSRRSRRRRRRVHARSRGTPRRAPKSAAVAPASRRKRRPSAGRPRARRGSPRRQDQFGQQQVHKETRRLMGRAMEARKP